MEGFFLETAAVTEYFYFNSSNELFRAFDKANFNEAFSDTAQ
jgi:hypothetical protein